MAKEVKFLYELGFRGADLLTACFGQAVSEFGRYEKVEKADGSEVTVAELLEMSRDAAFNAIVSDMDTDDFTRFYIGWLNLFGFTSADHDDVRRIIQIGLNLNGNDLVSRHLLLREGNRERLATYAERIDNHSRLGEDPGCPAIDALHRLMHLYDERNKIPREDLLAYIASHLDGFNTSYKRVLRAVAEVLPPGSDDRRQAAGLVANLDNLLKEASNRSITTTGQLNLEL